MDRLLNGKASDRIDMASPFIAKKDSRYLISKRASGVVGGWDREAELHDKQTNMEAVWNLVNNCLGTGLLTVPFAFRRVGLLGGIVGLAFSAVLNRFTLLLVVRCCRMAQTDVVVAQVGKEIFGAPGRYVVILGYASLCVGVLIAYTNALKDGVTRLLLLADIHLSTEQAALVVFVFLVPATFMRSMKKAAIVSFLAFVGAGMLIGGVVLRSGIDIVNGEKGDGFELYNADPYQIFAAAPLFTLALSAASGGPVVFASMRDDSERNMKRVSLMMYMIVFAMNLCLGGVAYWRFGVDTKGNIIDSLANADPAGVLARVGILFLAGLSYVFIVFPARVALIDLLFGKNEAAKEAEYWQFALITFLLSVFCQGIAYLVTNVALIVGVVGAISSNLISFILPALFYLMLCAKPRDWAKPKPIFSLEQLPYVVLLMFGICAMGTSLYSVVTTSAAAAASTTPLPNATLPA